MTCLTRACASGCVDVTCTGTGSSKPGSAVDHVSKDRRKEGHGHGAAWKRGTRGYSANVDLPRLEAVVSICK